MSDAKKQGAKGMGANVFGRRSFILGTGALAASWMLPGCSLSSGLTSGTGCNPIYGPGSCTPNPQSTPTGPVTTLDITLGTASVGAVGSGFAGLSYDKSHMPTGLWLSTNAPLIALYQMLGQSVLRICGGSVESTVWTPSGTGGVTGQVAPADIQALAGFVQAAGWKVIYGVALATSTPSAAAAEAACAVKYLGSNLLAIEIGNEPDNYSTNSVVAGYPAATWTFSQYLLAYESFAASILATTPGTPIAGPASGWNMQYFEGVASATVPGVSLLTQHYYRGNGASTTQCTLANLIAYPDTTLIGNYLVNMQPAAASAKLPWRMGETNSFYGQPQANTANAHASALWSLDHMFTMAQYGASGANFHGGDNTTTGYSPIANNGAVVVGPRPLFYGLYFFTLAGTGSMLQTTVSATSLNVSAYTVQNSSGGLSVVIVNKDPTQTLGVTLATNQTLKNGALSLLTNSGGLTATSGSTIQGESISNGGFYATNLNYTLTVSGNQTTCYVPPASAALVILS